MKVNIAALSALSKHTHFVPLAPSQSHTFSLITHTPVYQHPYTLTIHTCTFSYAHTLTALSLPLAGGSPLLLHPWQVLFKLAGFEMRLKALPTDLLLEENALTFIPDP